MSRQVFKRVCYITNWSQYRDGEAKWTPEKNLDVNMCTHIHYAFADMSENQLVAKGNDEDLYRQTIDKKRENPNLKVSLAVGGANFDLTKLTAMLSTPETRNTFITTSISFLRRRGFDGLDLDFECPGKAPSIPANKHGFTLLCQEARVAFNKEGAETGKAPLLLSAAVPVGKWAVDPGYEIPQVSQALDYINLMTYDFHGTWDSVTGFNSPLWARVDETNDQKQLNIDWGAKYWIQLGAPASKLIIGLATYGRGWTLANPKKNGVGAPALGPSNHGNYTKEAGLLAYFEMGQMINDPTWTKAYNSDQQCAYMYKGDQWIGFDNQQSFQEKVNYIRQNKYGGAMVWTMDYDDFSGKFCGQGQYPLISQLQTLQ